MTRAVMALSGRVARSKDVELSEIYYTDIKVIGIINKLNILYF